MSSTIYKVCVTLAFPKREIIELASACLNSRGSVKKSMITRFSRKLEMWLLLKFNTLYCHIVFHQLRELRLIIITQLGNNRLRKYLMTCQQLKMQIYGRDFIENWHNKQSRKLGHRCANMSSTMYKVCVTLGFPKREIIELASACLIAGGVWKSRW